MSRLIVKNEQDFYEEIDFNDTTYILGVKKDRAENPGETMPEVLIHEEEEVFYDVTCSIEDFDEGDFNKSGYIGDTDDDIFDPDIPNQLYYSMKNVLDDVEDIDVSFDSTEAVNNTI